MADVEINYKGSKIAEMSGTATKTLGTSGKYCEGDVSVVYAPRRKTYEITLTKQSGWVLLTTLDAEVIEHINDDNMLVTLVRTSGYSYANYTGAMYIVSNTPWGYSGSYPAYGCSVRETGATACQVKHNYYPANNTSTNDNLGGVGSFRITDGKYYLKAYDGYIGAGTYNLAFTW